MMSFHGDTVLDFSCQKQKSLSVEIFFVGRVELVG